jgi:hypothetical protein
LVIYLFSSNKDQQQDQAELLCLQKLQLPLQAPHLPKEQHLSKEQQQYQSLLLLVPWVYVVPSEAVVVSTYSVVLPGTAVVPWVDVVPSVTVVVSTGEVVLPGTVVVPWVDEVQLPLKAPHLPTEQQQYQAVLLNM